MHKILNRSNKEKLTDKNICAANTPFQFHLHYTLDRRLLHVLLKLHLIIVKISNSMLMLIVYNADIVVSCRNMV